MARKPSLSREALIGLGAERLADLALDEAEANAAFRNLLSAALAAARGPQAVAAIVDKRLAALEKARGAISAGRARAFVEDVAATLKIILGDLAKADPDGAAERLFRLIGAADRTYARVEPSGEAGLANVYDEAAAALPPLLGRLAAPDAAALADQIYRLAADSRSAVIVHAAPAILAAAPPGVTEALDARLADAVRALGPIAENTDDWSLRARARRLIDLRQLIADARGDVDAFIALEGARPGDAPDTASIAERLIEAGRAAEALEWLKRPARPGLRMLSMADFHVGLPPRDPFAARRAELEIRALDALGDREAAQALRWRLFSETLDADMLRAFVARLPDFEDVEALDRAFDLALATPLIYAALRFFVAWPRFDLAERLVLERRTQWDGKRYEALAPAAAALEDRQPLAATILYRALIDSILDRGQSVAYGHAARYYAALEGLEAREAPGAPIEPHRHYRDDLRRRHGRKYAFWSRVEGEAS